VATPPEKICSVCGRRMEWRKKWAKNWEHVRYCSDACRRRKNPPHHKVLEEKLLTLLEQRTGSICPSELARQEGGENWRNLMEPVREAARRLCAQGLLEFTQKGLRVDPSTAKGPIRLRKTGASLRSSNEWPRRE